MSISLQEISALINGKVFFVVGAARSGTTWLQLCLDGHPEIVCKGEGHFFDFLAPRLSKLLGAYNEEILRSNRLMYRSDEGFCRSEADDFDRLLQVFVASLLLKNATGSTYSWIGEKTPANTRHIGHLARLFPASRFIHIIRDGRDATVSAWMNNLRVSEQAALEKFGSFANYAGIYGKNWAAQISLAETFGHDNPGRYWRLSYEALHQDFDETFRPLCRFLAIDESEASLAACQAAGRFTKHSGDRKRGTEDRNSHFRRGEVGDWRNHFDAESTAAFEAAAGKTLRAVGYGQ